MKLRSNNILKDNSATDLSPAWAGSYQVVALPVGAVASASSSGTTATVKAGHGFAVGDKALIYSSGTGTFVAEALSSVTGTTLVWSSATPTIADGDLICNLGPDTASGATPNYDASPMKIFNRADVSDAISASTVTSDSQGDYEYWTEGGGASWELVLDASGTVVGVVPGWGGVAGRHNVCDYGCVGDDSTDNAARVKAVCTASASTGSWAWFPTGTFRIASAVQIAASTRLGSDGTGKISKAFTSALGISGAIFYSESSLQTDNIEVKGLRFTTVDATNYSGDFFELWSDNLRVSDCVVERYGGTANGGRCFVVRGDGVTITGLTIRNPAAVLACAGVRFLGGNGYNFSDSYIESVDDLIQLVPSTGGSWASTDITNAAISNITGSSTEARGINVNTDENSATIRDCSISNCTIDAGHEMVLVGLNSTGTGPITDITIDNITGRHDIEDDGNRAVRILNGDATTLVSKVSISNVHVVATDNATVSEGIFQMDNVNDCSFKDCVIDASAQVAGVGTVYIKGGLRNKIEGCTIIANGSQTGNEVPPIILGTGTTASNYSKIISNDITELGAGMAAVDFIEATRCRVSGNNIEIRSGVSSTVGVFERAGSTTTNGTDQGEHMVTGNDFRFVETPWKSAATNMGSIFEGNHLGLSSLTTGITAGTTQTQVGATALTSTLNIVNVVTTAGDGVALPSAKTGMRVTVVNNSGSNGLAVWPASGDSIFRASANAEDPDAAVATPLLANRASRTYYAVSSTVWYASSSGV